MEEMQTDTLSVYEKNSNVESTDYETKDTDNACAVNLLNGCDDIDDPLDLMDHCDNESLGSDVWKGSDSEDENYDSKNASSEQQNMNENTESNGKEVKCDEVGPKDDGSVVENKKREEQEKTQDQNDEDVNMIEAEQNTGKVEESTEKTEDTEPVENKSDNQDVEEQTKDQSEKEPLNETEINKTAEDIDEKGPLTNLEQNEASSAKNSEEDPLKDSSTKNNEEDPLKVSEDSSTKNNDEDPLKDNEQKKPENVEEDPLKLNEEKSDENDKNDDVVIIDKDPLGVDDDLPMFYNDDDDDLDPSLLCPEVSMAVDDNPVITSSSVVPGDDDASPLPYEPLFSTFVDEVTGAEISFNLNPEEQDLRKRLYGPTNPIQYTKLHCTACNVHLGSALEGQSNRFVHPLLKVLICKECYHFYTSGEFEKDEDGSELYCRWCGQGGQVLCCSKCEYVFCKRCIRNNFGRKTMFEIRDSENWDCYRCNPNQLLSQRVACYEFFEYVRRQMAVCTAEEWSKDYSRCCDLKKRVLENGEEVRRPKKKRGDVDPDYNPQRDIDPTAEKMKYLPKGFALPKPIQLLPRAPRDNDIEFVRTIPAPSVAVTPIRPRNIAGYRTILPNTARPMQLQTTATVMRINSSQQLPSILGGRLLGTSVQRNTMQRNYSTAPTMKHEWFEKTVRAAARVNSHLSYTLTQLNKAQSQAASIEELAVVHNKLQEILSSSINSLIQIRKNLRTEFISGIKTVKLPSRKATESFSNDDDVIIVSAPTTMPMPTVTPCVPKTDPLVVIDKSTTPAPDDEMPRIKVKSVKDLQNVPAECIIIPDDAPQVVPEVGNKKKEEEVKKNETDKVVCNGQKEECKDSTKNNNPESPENVETNLSEPELDSPKKKRFKGIDSYTDVVYNVTKEASPDIKRMMSVKVHVERADFSSIK